MSSIAIVVSETEGGLYAAVEDTDFFIIEESKEEFSSLSMYTDVPMSVIGEIGTGREGWIALAVADD